MKDYHIHELGFDTWLELYEYLESQNLQLETRICLFWPPEEEVVIEEISDMKKLKEQKEIYLETDFIRAQAFRELWISTPLKKNVETLIFKLNQIHDRVLIRQEAAKFLNQLKTRTR